jgi:hypothetical protein
MIMMNIEVGTPVVANYGAMHPTVNGVVTEVFEDGLVNVQFDDGIYRVAVRLRDDFAAPKGSPIGLFVNCYEVA